MPSACAAHARGAHRVLPCRLKQLILNTNQLSGTLPSFEALVNVEVMQLYRCCIAVLLACLAGRFSVWYACMDACMDALSPPLRLVLISAPRSLLLVFCPCLLGHLSQPRVLLCLWRCRFPCPDPQQLADRAGAADAWAAAAALALALQQSAGALFLAFWVEPVSCTHAGAFFAACLMSI